MMRRTFFAIAVYMFALSVRAQTEDSEDTSDVRSARVEISFDEKRETPDTSATAPPVEQLFKNPALVSGLASGADAINRSIESLLDAMFYSLLDNELKLDMTDHSWFSSNLQRDVFSAPSGSYIVVDRINLGPRYGRELWNVHNIPITLGVEGTVEVLQIYLRSDGQRLAEQAELPAWRRILNNWFGLLPLVSSLLPPSFNQNELYDPLRQAATPFVFPLDTETFYGMPIGSIRSYAISGGGTYALDFGGLLDQRAREFLLTLEGMDDSLPYQVFVKGEHRINVLRRGEHTAWVGMSRVKRLGHSISTVLGNTLFLLSGAMSAQIWQWDWVWNGVPAPMFPVDARLEQAAAGMFDQLYEYDLRNPHAQEAYLAAVTGDFTVSHSKWLFHVEQEIDTGVTYHFTRVQSRDEFQARNSPNIAVLKKERTTELSDAVIEITDPDGKFYILEAQQRLREKWLDVLVGEESKEHQQVAEIKVKKVLVEPDDPRLGDQREIEEVSVRERIPTIYGGSRWIAKEPSGPGEESFSADSPDGPVIPKDWQDSDGDGQPDNKREAYVLSYDDNDPVQLTMNFNVQDRYIDAEEYQEYIELLRFFTMLPIEDVAKIRVRDEARQRTHRRFAFFDDPTRAAINLHVTPTYLGKFGAQAIVSFNAKELDKILQTSVDDKWRAFAMAFGKDPKEWGDPAVRNTLGFQSQSMATFFLAPTRLFNVRFASVDAIRDATNAIDAMEKISEEEIPLKRIELFYQLFDTHHPLYLTRALLILSDLDNIPRWVSLSTDPKGSAPTHVKDAFRRMNGKEFRSSVEIPPPTRYRKAKKKLAAFYLDQPREVNDRPQIRSIEVFTKDIPDSVRGLEAEGESDVPLDRQKKHVYIRVKVQGMQPERSGKIYIRVEQAGKVKFGKLELAEKVIELSPSSAPSDPNILTYEFYCTGPLSPLSNFMFDSSVDSGDDFLVSLGASVDGEVWSDERSLEFHFSNGQLRPIDDD